MEEERNDVITTDDGYDIVDNNSDSSEDEGAGILAIAAFGTACAGLGYIVIQHVIKPIAKLAIAGIKKLFKKNDEEEDDGYEDEDEADEEEDDGEEEEQEEKPAPKTKKTRSKRRRK